MAAGKKDLIEIGSRFGKLVIVEVEPSAGRGAQKRVLVKCDCGNVVSRQWQSIKEGMTTHCGCSRVSTRKYEVQIGQQFGRWTVIADAGVSSCRSVQVRVRCACGEEAIRKLKDLANGKSKGCKCVLRDFQKARQASMERELIEDLVGQTFAFLTVLEILPSEKDEFGKNKPRQARCSCVCGNTVTPQVNSLYNGGAKSCGCYSRLISSQSVDRLLKNRKPAQDLTGQVFGRVTVLSLNHIDGGHRTWNCRCNVCGDEMRIRGDNLKINSLPYCTCTPFVPPSRRIKHA